MAVSNITDTKEIEKLLTFFKGSRLPVIVSSGDQGNKDDIEGQFSEVTGYTATIKFPKPISINES